MEIEFLEEYKRLDRLCQDMLSTLQGVSEYINRMELLFEQGEEFVDEWTINYKMLKHLRWLRNRIVHCVEETECSLKEIEMITNFYHQILIQQDPLALLYKINQKIYKNKTTNQEKNKNIDNSSKITMLITIVLIIIFVLFIAGILNCI
ncbi:MAG: DUF6548 family protein [Thomasclavelia spiroformis]|uniref:DUF6548 family protein n=1 Tax=Thomasclavelia spiroformis TaxID=29348 RepID=UPI0011C1476E|nr:DUF6548 family protein [Thomasclavelia spiroformis]